MELKFDPTEPTDCENVLAVLVALHGAEFLSAVTPAVPVSSGGPAQIQLAPLDGPDNRDAASVFAAAGGAPLALAPSTAAAGLSQTAPGGLPASFQTAMPGMQPAAAGALQPAGAPSGAVAQTNPVAGVVTDKNGLPWDVRIHAKNKAQNKDGSWRAKTGLNDGAFVKQVETELRSTMALPAAATPAFVPPTGTAPLQLLQPLQPAQPATPAGPPANFDEMMPRITAKEVAGLVPPGIVLAACQAHQLPSVVALTARPDYVGQIWAYLVGQYPVLAQ